MSDYQKYGKYPRTVLDAIRKHGFIDDEGVAYRPGNYGLTHEEFKGFVDEVFDNEGGGWDGVDRFKDPDAYFDTYDIPFERDGEKFWLTLMSGQGYAWIMTTEAEFEKLKARRTGKDWKDEDEE